MIVAVSTPDRIFTVIDDSGRGTASKNIIGCIDRALLAAGTKLKDIDYLGAVVGPGSFTGIRIGISIVNAFHLALGIPLVSISAFEALAEGAEGRTLCLIDARHGCYYGAVRELGAIINDREYTQAEAVKFEGAIVMRTRSSNLESMAKAAVIDGELYANKLCAIMQRKAAAGNTVPYLIPMYMKLSQAERNENK